MARKFTYAEESNPGPVVKKDWRTDESQPGLVAGLLADWGHYGGLMIEWNTAAVLRSADGSGEPPVTNGVSPAWELADTVIWIKAVVVGQSGAATDYPMDRWRLCRQYGLIMNRWSGHSDSAGGELYLSILKRICWELEKNLLVKSRWRKPRIVTPVVHRWLFNRCNWRQPGESMANQILSNAESVRTTF